MLERDIVADVPAFGRVRHVRDAPDRVVEPPHPLRAAGRHARADEVVTIERQHEIDLGPRVEGGRDEQQVGAARRRCVEDRRVHARDARAQLGVDCRHQRGGKARRRRIGSVDAVSRERDDVGRAQDREHVHRLRQRAREERELPAHRCDRAGVAGRGRECHRVARAGEIDPAEEQRRLAGRRMVPA